MFIMVIVTYDNRNAIMYPESSNRKLETYKSGETTERDNKSQHQHNSHATIHIQGE